MMNNVNSKYIEELLSEFIGEDDDCVLSAMKYSLFQGGKRIRPTLMKLMYDANNGTSRAIRPFMAAIEMIHTYSLIHDDLPAMDDDNLRRGVPTCHIKYNEATAILAGDGLLNKSIEVCVRAFDYNDINKENIIKAIDKLYFYSGTNGMIKGQSYDLQNEKSGLNKLKDSEKIERLKKTYNLKTSALIIASLEIGAILANANEDEINSSIKIGEKIGLAFQIRDDVLDVTSSDKVLGKTVGSDSENNKFTFVDLLGIEECNRLTNDYIDEAISMLDIYKGDTQGLKELFTKLKVRKY